MLQKGRYVHHHTQSPDSPVVLDSVRLVKANTRHRIQCVSKLVLWNSHGYCLSPQSSTVFFVSYRKDSCFVEQSNVLVDFRSMKSFLQHALTTICVDGPGPCQCEVSQVLREQLTHIHNERGAFSLRSMAVPCDRILHLARLRDCPEHSRLSAQTGQLQRTAIMS